MLGTIILMIGSIVGDIVGSIYEFNNIKTKDFALFSEGDNFTDDTILSVATADWILNGDSVANYYYNYGLKYRKPMGGYGNGFARWLFKGKKLGHPFGTFISCGNGAAMRVGPIGWAYNTEEDVLAKAEESAKCTHNHPEGIKGAKAVALCIYMARNGKTKAEIKKAIESKIGYKLNFTVNELQATYSMHSKWGDSGLCQGSVPQAIVCFLEGTDFEDCIRNAVSIGGDSDTIADITGSIAEAFFGVPQAIRAKAMSYLDEDQTKVVNAFEAKYGNKIIK